MDFLQEHIPNLLPQAYHFYKDYSPYITPILRFLLLAQSHFYRYVYPLLYPLYTLANTTLHHLSSDSPDLLTLLALAVVLFISLRVLDYMRRTVIRWITLAIQLSLWIFLAAAGVYVYYRGVEQSVEDLGWVWGVMQGLEREGEAVGGRKARGREREAYRMKGPGRGRTRGAGW